MSVRILVVHNAALSEEALEAIPSPFVGVDPAELEVVPFKVILGDAPDMVHERVEEVLEKDADIGLVYVIEDDGPVSDWYFDTCLGDWLDMGIPAVSNNGFCAGKFGMSAEEEPE
jgi:hypothetical protein